MSKEILRPQAKPAPTAQPVPVPLAHIVGEIDHMGKVWTPAAPQRKPLTREEIWSAIRPLTKSDEVCKALVDVSMDEYRAIEAAHGIKENT
jgi:hypothetical protein